MYIIKNIMSNKNMLIIHPRISQKSPDLPPDIEYIIKDTNHDSFKMDVVNGSDTSRSPTQQEILEAL